MGPVVEVVLGLAILARWRLLPGRRLEPSLRLLKFIHKPVHVDDQVLDHTLVSHRPNRNHTVGASTTLGGADLRLASKHAASIDLHGT